MFWKYFLKKFFNYKYIPNYQIFITDAHRPYKLQLTNLIIIKIQN